MNEGEYSTDPDHPGSWIVPELLIRFVRANNELNRCDQIREGGVLSAQQVRALIFLVHHDGATIKALAQALSVSEARASRLAEELAELGNVLHERDVVDRRQVRLHVTPPAAERARRMYRERSGAIEAALRDASPDELRVFTHLLGRIVEEYEALLRRRAGATAVPGDVGIATQPRHRGVPLQPDSL